MPKEGDQLEDGTDKVSKEEVIKDASEDMVRKTVQAATPSLHGGNTSEGKKKNG